MSGHRSCGKGALCIKSTHARTLSPVPVFRVAEG